MKTLIIDIETAPSLAWVWKLHGEQHIGLNQLVKTTDVMCWAAKWHGGKKIYFKSSYEHGHEEMVAEAHRLMDEADAIVHYNGVAFDMKHLRREFLLAGLPPTSEHKDIDLLKTVRQQFKFVSNKLDHVATELGLGSKVSHNGFELWVGAMQHDKASLRKMREYNCQDVVLTEQLYDKLKPWLKGPPNVSVLKGRPDVCPRCGAEGPFQARGFKTTQTMRYRRWQCNTCGGYFRSRKAEPGDRPEYVS